LGGEHGHGNPNQAKTKHTQDHSSLECMMLHFLFPQLSTAAPPRLLSPELAFNQAYPLNKSKTYIRRKHFWGWESFLVCVFSYSPHFEWFASFPTSVPPLSERDYRHVEV